MSEVPRVVTPSRWPFARWVGLGLGILASVIVLLVALNVGRLRERVFGRADAPRIESLAVLPVKNFSGDPAQEFFADGMTDALIAGLAQIKAVKVISRTSVMHYKGSSETLPQIAKELGVDGIVETSVMRSGGRVRITAQLIEARQDRHLWASTYERDMTDVLALQSELVQAIAGEIRIQLTPQESERLKTTRRVDPEVYDATSKARQRSSTRRARNKYVRRSSYSKRQLTGIRLRPSLGGIRRSHMGSGRLRIRVRITGRSARQGDRGRREGAGARPNPSGSSQGASGHRS